MTPKQAGQQFVERLLADPAGFTERGEAYQLLQCYFAGFPLDTLRPLLDSNNVLVQRAAVFITGELGRAASVLVDAVVPLLNHEERYLRYNALEVLAVCATGSRAAHFVALLQALEDIDPSIRVLAMRMVCNADSSQLQAGRVFFSSPHDHREEHARGLSVLTGDTVETRDIEQLLQSPAPLARRYGAIAAGRIFANTPALLDVAARSPDEDIREFCRRVRLSHGGRPV